MDCLGRIERDGIVGGNSPCFTFQITASAYCLGMRISVRCISSQGILSSFFGPFLPTIEGHSVPQGRAFCKESKWSASSAYRGHQQLRGASAMVVAGDSQKPLLEYVC